MEIPAEYHHLFWDTCPETIDPEARAPYVLERILVYASLAAAGWALEAYGRERIADFLRGGGWRTLSQKTLSFWVMLLGLDGEPCFQPSSLKSSRPFWDY